MRTGCLHRLRHAVSIGAHMNTRRGGSHRSGRERPSALLPLLMLLPWLVPSTTGCSPSRVLAGAILKAPNTYPRWLAPPARVSLHLPKAVLTNLPVEHIEVGPPAARLWVGLVPPGDYQSQLSSTNRWRGRRQEFSFMIRAVFPPHPLDDPTTRTMASTSAARGTVFLLHGYGVDSLSMLPWGITVAEAGYLGVLVDLRGHGESTGRQVGFGTVETADLCQVLDRLSSQGKVHGPVAVMGESLGAAIALRWAATDPRIAAVVAFAPYAELESAVLGIRDDYTAWLPRGWVRGAARRLPALLDVPPEGLDTSSHVHGLTTPALLVAAGHDGIAPPPAVGRLARLCAGPVKYMTLPSAHHETLPYHFGELRETVLVWLETYCR